jgi:uncharacterized protein YecE (DUF72 family)
VPVLIGTSGWHYQHWKGGFYPTGRPASQWLELYAQRFATVEINNAFYRLPERAAFEAWAKSVPDDFVFAVKASRYLTHVRRLRQPQEPVQRLLERAAGLGPKLGPVLLQLPPNLRIDLDALEGVLTAFGPNIRVAVEARHDSWCDAATRALLERYEGAWCLTDRAGQGMPRWRTADWGYVRFHAGRAHPPPCYGRTALRTWAAELARLWPRSADVYAYFNNDQHGCAPRDARRFALAVGQVGLGPTRVPATRETPVAT